MLNNTIDKTVGMLQGLTEKIVNLKQKTDQNSLLNQEYEELNSKIDILSAMFNSNNSSSTESDIVRLLNLPRPISEYTNDNIGEIISIPYNDESGKILLNDGCIEFEVVGVNHHKDINDESKSTITLMTKNIIRCAAFDAVEPNNPLYDNDLGWTERADSGNNRWGVSNIRQWLNSEGAANEWFTPQHEYDEAPTADKVDHGDGSCADYPGFLAGFSDEVKQHFTIVRNNTFLLPADRSEDSKVLEETEDKVFLPSYTEIGFGNNKNSPEGVHLAKKFTNTDSRVKNGANNCNRYWLRSIGYGTANLHYIDDEGFDDDMMNASNDKIGIAPLIVLC